jgi:ribosome recycling factor
MTIFLKKRFYHKDKLEKQKLLEEQYGGDGEDLFAGIISKDGTSEDICKGAEDEIQSLTDKHIALVEKHLEAKEKEIMTV